MVALVMYFLFGAILDFGRAFFAAQTIQTAVDFGAREFSRAPLPATGFSLTNYLVNGSNDPDESFSSYQALLQRIYNPDYLVVPLGSSPLTDATAWPVLNAQLYPLMIPDFTRGVLYYPGSIVAGTNQSTGANYTHAGIYRLDTTTGAMLPTPVPVVQEIVPMSNNGASPFDVTSPQQGLVALRINYPFNAATMVSYNYSTGGQGQTVSTPVVSSETGDTPGPYAGSDGGGELLAWGETVRPFQRLISAQAVYRREMFASASTSTSTSTTSP